MYLSNWIAAKIAPGHGDPSDLRARARVGLLEGWVSVVVNTGLAAFKGWLGLLTGSVALLADTAHTFADSLTSVVVIFGFRMAVKPADPEHPFGHGRAESVAGVVVAVLLGVAAFEMGRAGVEQEIAARFPGHAIVHVDPVNPEHPRYVPVRRIVENVLAGEPACESFHDLRLVGTDERFKVVFDISTRHGLSEGDRGECRKRIASRLASELPGTEIVIDVEPSYLHDAPAAGEEK